MAAAPPVPIHNVLPQGLIRNILSYLGPRDLCACEQVCKLWQELVISLDSTSWKRHFCHDYSWTLFIPDIPSKYLPNPNDPNARYGQTFWKSQYKCQSMWSRVWNRGIGKRDDKARPSFGCMQLTRGIKLRKLVIVGGAGATYQSLRECMSAALPFSTVVINPGVYDEQTKICVSYPMEFIGNGDPQDIIINVAIDFEADTSRMKNLTLKAPWFHEAVIEARCGHLQVENCIFESSSVHIYGSSSCAFRYCHFYRSPLSFFYQGIAIVDSCVFSDIRATNSNSANSNADASTFVLRLPTATTTTTTTTGGGGAHTVRSNATGGVNSSIPGQLMGPNGGGGIRCRRQHYVTCECSRRLRHQQQHQPFCRYNLGMTTTVPTVRGAVTEYAHFRLQHLQQHQRRTPRTPPHPPQPQPPPPIVAAVPPPPPPALVAPIILPPPPPPPAPVDGEQAAVLPPLPPPPAAAVVPVIPLPLQQPPPLPPHQQQQPGGGGGGGLINNAPLPTGAADMAAAVDYLDPFMPVAVLRIPAHPPDNGGGVGIGGGGGVGGGNGNGVGIAANGEERSSNHAVIVNSSGRFSHSAIQKFIHDFKLDVIADMLHCEKDLVLIDENSFNSTSGMKKTNSHQQTHSSSAAVSTSSSNESFNATNRKSSSSSSPAPTTTIINNNNNKATNKSMATTNLSSNDIPPKNKKTSNSKTSSTTAAEKMSVPEIGTDELSEQVATLSRTIYGPIPLDSAFKKHQNTLDLLHRIRGPIFYRCKFDGVYSAMHVSHSGNVSVLQCEFTHVGHAIKTVKKAKILLMGNRFHNIQGSVLNLKARTQGIIAENEFHKLDDNVALVRLRSNPYFICNKIYDGKRSGILVLGKSKPSILYNEFHHLTGPAICSLYMGDPYVRLNRIHHCDGFGVAIMDGGRGYYRENDLSECKVGLISCIEGLPIVVSNWCHRNACGGIVLNDKGGGVYAQNFITENNGPGLNIVNSKFVRVHGNRITNNASHGVRISSSQMQDINNLIQTTRQSLDLIQNRFSFRDPMSSDDSEAEDPVYLESVCSFRTHEWSHSKFENNFLANNKGSGFFCDDNYAVQLWNNYFIRNSQHGICLHNPGVSGALFPPPKTFRDHHNSRSLRSLSIIDMCVDISEVNESFSISYELLEDLRRVTVARVLHNKICENAGCGLWAQLSSYSRGRVEVKGNGIYNNSSHGIYTGLQTEIFQNDIFCNAEAAVFAATGNSKINVVDNRLHSSIGRIFCFVSADSLQTTINNIFLTSSQQEHIFNMIDPRCPRMAPYGFFDTQNIVPWEKPPAYQSDFPTNFVMIVRDHLVRSAPDNHSLINTSIGIPSWFPSDPPPRPKTIVPPTFTDWSQHYEKNSTFSKACCLL